MPRTALGLLAATALLGVPSTVLAQPAPRTRGPCTDCWARGCSALAAGSAPGVGGGAFRHPIARTDASDASDASPTTDTTKKTDRLTRPGL